MPDFSDKKLTPAVTQAFSRYMTDIDLLRDLTGGTEVGFGVFESQRPGISSGPVYVVKKDDALEIAAILNEHIPGGAQPFFGHAGRVQIGIETLHRYSAPLMSERSAIRAEIEAFEAESAAPLKKRDLRLLK